MYTGTKIFVSWIKVHPAVKQTWYGLLFRIALSVTPLAMDEIKSQEEKLRQ